MIISYSEVLPFADFYVTVYRAVLYELVKEMCIMLNFRSIIIFDINSNNRSMELHSQINERRDRGRPTKTWMDNIMEDIKAQGMDFREATDKARER